MASRDLVQVIDAKDFVLSLIHLCFYFTDLGYVSKEQWNLSIKDTLGQATLPLL